MTHRQKACLDCFVHPMALASFTRSRQLTTIFKPHVLNECQRLQQFQVSHIMAGTQATVRTRQQLIRGVPVPSEVLTLGAMFGMCLSWPKLKAFPSSLTCCSRMINGIWASATSVYFSFYRKPTCTGKIAW